MAGASIEASIVLGADAPAAPDRAEVESLLAELADLVRASGWQRFARPPVVSGEASFPDPWQPSPSGVALLLRRLLWHADLDLAIGVDDRRDQAGPRPRRAVTDAEIVSVGDRGAVLALYSIGNDDVAGSLAHEVGVAWAADLRRRAADPYRSPSEAATTEPTELDQRRGSIAAVAVGLGPLATAAAYQHYTGGEYQTHLGFAPVEYDVIQAGHLPLAAMAFLVAVQAEVRGERGAVGGLRGPAADEVAAWRRALAGQGEVLRTRLDLPEPGSWPQLERPRPAPFAADLPRPAGPRRAEGKRVFRVRGHRGALGFVVGTVGGAAASFALGLPGLEAGTALLAGAAAGLGLGRRVAVARCSECIERVAVDAGECPRCGGRFAGDIADRNDRLAAEEDADGS